MLAQEAERAEAAGHDRAGRGDRAAGRAHAAAGRLSPRARARRRVRRDAGRALLASCESAEGLARTLRRLHADRGLAIDVRSRRRIMRCAASAKISTRCSATCSTTPASGRGPRHDRLDAERNGVIAIIVDDDGPGLAAAMREAVLQRGVRADEAAPGSGFGLAIVRDLAELYGGSIALSDSPAGGLRAELQLPAADSTPAVRPADVGSA